MALPLPGPNKFDGPQDKDPNNHGNGDKQKKSMGKFDRMKRIDRDMESSMDEVMEDSLEGQKEGGIQSVRPLAAFHPTLGIIDMGKMKKSQDQGVITHSNFTKEDVTAPQLIPTEDQLLVHGRGGSYLMEKAKWPKLVLRGEKNLNLRSL